jgi:DNA-binding NarL/FixJ family response regulator
MAKINDLEQSQGPPLLSEKYTQVASAAVNISRAALNAQGIEPNYFHNLDEILTPRERLTLELLAQGMSREEIADYSAITKSTVSESIRKIKEKFGVESDVQAVLVFLTSETSVRPARNREDVLVETARLLARAGFLLDSLTARTQTTPTELDEDSVFPPTLPPPRPLDPALARKSIIGAVAESAGVTTADLDSVDRPEVDYSLQADILEHLSKGKRRWEIDQALKQTGHRFGQGELAQLINRYMGELEAKTTPHLVATAIIERLVPVEVDETVRPKLGSDEEKVLEGIRIGKTDEEIRAENELTDSRLKKAASSLYQKHGVQNGSRELLVRRSFERGTSILPPIKNGNE